MPYFRIAGLMVHVKLGGPKSKQPKPCAARIPAPPEVGPGTVLCCAISGFLCDFELPQGGTCDRPLCEEHAHQVAKDRHLCPEHLERLRAVEPLLL